MQRQSKAGKTTGALPGADQATMQAERAGVAKTISTRLRLKERAWSRAALSPAVSFSTPAIICPDKPRQRVSATRLKVTTPPGVPLWVRGD